MLKYFFILLICLWSALSVAEQDFRVVTENHPPVQYLHQGKISGPATEIVRDLLKRTEIEARIELMPWARAYDIALNRPKVLIYSMFRTPEREDKFYWLRSVSEHKVAVLALRERDDLDFRQLSDAKPHLFAVIRGAYSLDYLKKAGFSEQQNLFIAATMNEQVDLLLKGKVDLLFTDPATVRYRLEQLGHAPEQVKVVLELPELAQDLYLAVSLDTAPYWIEKLQQAVKQQRADGI
ncbi:substrate-binding periplasmic protein [Lacimicrobium alkaliphilum]|uniref:Solute-binding protein family 3/N-terminal domain-containing protein n=1 Tax=Lacimicrobium alkaliphilum TaxID=1526571 RepID=A0A0U2ZJ64_9ALTE|nr:transporter substrate-binding domain-containing protein [Lacimicrobium alkaliphilum]ALS98348.1 hypothetical protein AT746_08835 [Lacimicrobium alkaliphilum]